MRHCFLTAHERTVKRKVRTIAARTVAGNLTVVKRLKSLAYRP